MSGHEVPTDSREPAKKIPANYEEARILADKARDRANAVRQQWIEWARDVELRGVRSWYPFTAEQIGSRRAGDDPRWKDAVALNQWMIQYATMYGMGQLIEIKNTD